MLTLHLFKTAKHRKLFCIMVCIALICFILTFFGTLTAVRNVETLSPFKQFITFFCVFLKALIDTVMLLQARSNYNYFGSIAQNNIWFTTAYFMINFIMVIFISIAFLTIISTRINSLIKIYFSNPKKIHIFTNINDKSLALAKDIAKDDKNSLIIFISEVLKAKDASTSTNKSLIKEGFAIVYLDNGKTFFEKIGLPARYNKIPANIYIFSNNDAENLQYATCDLIEFQNNKLVNIYVELADANLLQNNISSNMTILSTGELSAMALDFKMPLYKTISPNEIVDGCVNKTLRLAIVGFGHTGEAVFKELYCGGQTKNLNIETVIFDQNMDSKIGLFYDKYPYLKASSKIEVVNCNSFDETFFSYINSTVFDYFAISMGDDAVSTKLANQINQNYTRKNVNTIIAVKIRNKTNELLLSSSSTMVTVHSFGNYNDIYNVDNIIHERFYDIAKVYNYAYSKIYDALFNECKQKFDTTNSLIEYKSSYEYKSASYNSLINEIKNMDTHILTDCAEKEWHKTPLTNRKSSLANAEHFLHKLYLVQAENNTDALVKLQNNSALRNNLAITEHQRWNEYFIANGWGPMDYKKLLSNEQFASEPNCDKHKWRKNEKSMQHACIASWSNLQEINEIFKQNYYIYDYLTIDILEILLSKNIINCSML